MCVGCVCTFWRECKLTPSCERMCPPLPLQELYLQKMPNQESMEQAKLWKIERLNYKTAWYIVEGLKMSHSSQNSWNVLEVLETWWPCPVLTAAWGATCLLVSGWVGWGCPNNHPTKPLGHSLFPLLHSKDCGTGWASYKLPINREYGRRELQGHRSQKGSGWVEAFQKYLLASKLGFKFMKSYVKVWYKPSYWKPRGSGVCVVGQWAVGILPARCCPSPQRPLQKTI